MRFLWFAVLLIHISAVYVAGETNTGPVVQLLVPGFDVKELPVQLSNQNNLRFAPDGTLTSLGYDGRIWRLKDTNGDGLEDTAEPLWNKSTLSVPLGMAWTTHGLLVSSKGKVSLLTDTNDDGALDEEQMIASGWPSTDVGSGGVDATAVTLDREGNVYFGLLVADYSNAYRLRKRKDLRPAEVQWLKQNGRWRDPVGAAADEDEFSLYDLNFARGTIQKWDPQTKELSTIATGMRVPVALAFNRAGDLFNTDQEGETWMPNGNPLDELNHIVAGRNYGFPPRHEKWLPGLLSEAPVIAFGPQHQSACGLVFNEPHQPAKKAPVRSSIPLPAFPAQGLFGPAAWEGNAFVAGESRGKIWRVQLAKTAKGYVGAAQTIARLTMLTLDVAISPHGELYVACHSGPPDWGTGPNGSGKIFKISYRNRSAPMPLATWPASPTEVRITFDKAVDSQVVSSIEKAGIEFGEYVSAGDRLERLKPPYAVVGQQDASPRGRLAILSAALEEGGRTLMLKTDPHPLSVRYALTLPGVKAPGSPGPGETIDLDYDLTRSAQPFPSDPTTISPRTWKQPLAWAPKIRASGGTDSRAGNKPDGDWEHGRELFFGAELQCAKCHRIRGEGGVAAPDLSNLSHRDTASVSRDIREPSATIHPDYVTWQIALGNGDSLQGFIRSQNKDSIEIFDVDGKKTVVLRSDVQSIRPSELSLMPAGLLNGRSDTDVRDLLTFLMWEPPQRPLGATNNFSGFALKNIQLVLVASKQDHGAGQHDYPRWQTNWARQFKAAGVAAQTAWEWPSQAQFDSATVLVFYFWNHDWSPARYAQFQKFLARGGGVVLIHAAIIADKDPEQLADLIGLAAQPGRTGYRHMPFDLHLSDRSDRITRDLPEYLELLDEPYWPLVGESRNVHVLASAMVDGESRPLIWTREVGEGRIFASIPGHYTRTLDDAVFQTILLRGIEWAGEKQIQSAKNAR